MRELAATLALPGVNFSQEQKSAMQEQAGRVYLRGLQTRDKYRTLMEEEKKLMRAALCKPYLHDEERKEKAASGK